MEKHRLQYLDLVIQYSCNLSCSGCISLSNYNRKGTVSYNDGEQWLKEWSKLIDCDIICLFGGEPLLNKDFGKWVRGVREYFPSSRIKIITNIFYLREDHVDLLVEVGNSTLQCSYHYRGNDTYDMLKGIVTKCISKYKWKPIPNDEISLLTLQHKDVVVKNTVFGEFKTPMKAVDGKIYHRDSKDLQKSISICGNPRNPVLFKNRLFKCSPIANLEDTLSALGQSEEDDWQPFLDYKGYGLNDDIAEFADDVGNPNKICSMCSDDPNKIQNVDHYADGQVRSRKKCL